MNQSVAEPNATVHPDGATLMAVAEGRTDAQPSDDTLGHIFSCPECHGALQEIRSGLQAMGALSDVPVTPAEDPASQWPAELMLASAGASESSEVDPGRMVKKMAIACVVVIVAMVLLRFWLANMS